MSIIQQFISRFYQIIILVLLVTVLILLVFSGVQTWRVSSSKADYQLLDAQYKKEAAEAKAQANAKEKYWSDQLLEAEKNYNVKIKEITNDANAADRAANSLSKQLAEAKRNLSTASKETIIEYIDTNSDILKSCITEYRAMAKAADEHAADAKRLSDAWPE